MKKKRAWNKDKHERFCIHGHDTNIRGRNKWNGCRDCKDDRKKDSKIIEKRVPTIQFCPKNHDTFECGRNKDGQCKRCKCEKGKISYENNKDKVREQGKIRREKNKEKEKIRHKIYYETHKDKVKEYQKANVERIRARNKKRYEEKKEILLAKAREWRENHKEERSVYNKKYREEHKKEINDQWNKRIAKDLNFKLRTSLRGRIRGAIKKAIKAGSAVKDLGCSIDFFKEYIEGKFYDDMAWSNWGTYWELDHIKELADFDLTDRKQFLEAVHYTNYRPLTIPHHLMKTIKEKARRAKERRNKSK